MFPVNDIVSNLIALQMSGSGTAAPAELPNAVFLEEEEGSVVGGSGSYIVIENYSGNKQKKVRLSVYYFKTANEQLGTIYFLNDDGSTKSYINFSNYYIG